MANTYITLFDYENKPKVVTLPCAYSDVKRMVVTILTGDEVVDVYTKNGDCIHADALDEKKSRLAQYFDGVYEVYPEDMERWITLPNHISDWDDLAFPVSERRMYLFENGLS